MKLLKKRIFIIIFIVFCATSALAADLGTLIPGINNSITISIDFLDKDKQEPPENRYAQIINSNFNPNESIYLQTLDGTTITTLPTYIYVEKKATSYKLFLSCQEDTPGGFYNFSLYLFTNKNGKIEGEQYLDFTFRIERNITLTEIPLWNPPSLGEPWESQILSRHTIKLTANHDWKLYLKAFESLQGLHAVIIQRNPENLSSPIDVIVSTNLTQVLEGSSTKNNQEKAIVFTILTYAEDQRLLPAGSIDITIFLEAILVPDNSSQVFITKL